MKQLLSLLTGVGLTAMAVGLGTAQASGKCAWGGEYSEGSRKCVCVIHREESLSETRHWHIIGVPYVCEDGKWKISPVPESGHEKCVDIEYKWVEAAAVAINSPVIAGICRQD